MVAIVSSMSSIIFTTFTSIPKSFGCTPSSFDFCAISSAIFCINLTSSSIWFANVSALPKDWSSLFLNFPKFDKSSTNFCAAELRLLLPLVNLEATLLKS